MSSMSTKYLLKFILLVALSQFYCGQVFSQTKWKTVSEGIESMDSLVVLDEDTTTFEIIRNHWLGIEIRSRGHYFDSGAPTWLCKNAIKAGWRRFANNKLGITFDYPPDYKVRRRIEEQDTTIELLLNAPISKRPQATRDRSNSLLTIQFTDNSFDERAEAYGFIRKDDWWYVDGVTLQEATYIIANGWLALEGENTYMTPLEGGGMAATSDFVSFAMKDLSPRRSAMFFKSLDMRNEVFVAIVSTFRYLK